MVHREFEVADRKFNTWMVMLVGAARGLDLAMAYEMNRTGKNRTEN